MALPLTQNIEKQLEKKGTFLFFFYLFLHQLGMDSGVVASSTYDASSQPSNTNTINNHWWNHGTEVLNTMTSTEKERGKKTKTSSERAELFPPDPTASPMVISLPV